MFLNALFVDSFANSASLKRSANSASLDFTLKMVNASNVNLLAKNVKI